MTSRRRRAFTYSLFTVATLLVALAAGAVPHLRKKTPPPAPPVVAVPTPAPVPPTPVVAQPAPPRPEPPQIEVVFALDTTSSMTGLIDGARRKIWSLVNYISSAQPQPHVRIGLVAYRDKGDEYVTRFYDLSDDLDEVFRHLTRLRAEGGGDTPEHVAKGLSDAVTRTSWSAGQNVARLVYLVGDAPPQDYGDGYDANAVARRAAEKGIRVNAIRCGSDDETALAFRRIARLGGGQYSSVEQSGGMADVGTTYDERLAELNRKLLGTTIAYGAGAAGMRAKIAAAGAAPASVAADRAEFAARNRIAVSGEGDLVGAIATSGKGAAYVNTMAPAQLPPEVAALAPREREKYVADKMAERTKVMGEIKELAARRGAEMATTAAARPRRADGLDDEVKRSLRQQTAGLLSF